MIVNLGTSCDGIWLPPGEVGAVNQYWARKCLFNKQPRDIFRNPFSRTFTIIHLTRWLIFLPYKQPHLHARVRRAHMDNIEPCMYTHRYLHINVRPRGYKQATTGAFQAQLLKDIFGEDFEMKYQYKDHPRRYNTYIYNKLMHTSYFVQL